MAAVTAKRYHYPRNAAPSTCQGLCWSECARSENMWIGSNTCKSRVWRVCMEGSSRLDRLPELVSLLVQRWITDGELEIHKEVTNT